MTSPEKLATPEINHASAETAKVLEHAIGALADILGGWRYIRQSHGDLYGVGWDRCEKSASIAIAALRTEVSRLATQRQTGAEAVAPEAKPEWPKGAFFTDGEGNFYDEQAEPLDHAFAPPAPPAPLPGKESRHMDESELFCPQCNGSGEGRAMTTGHGPDDYEYDCPCQLCGGDGSLLKAFQGMQADRDQFRQKYYAALRGYPEKPLTAQELETLELVIEQFADCGETDVDYAVLMNFARRGYLECERFTDTPKARAAITSAKEQTK